MRSQNWGSGPRRGFPKATAAAGPSAVEQALTEISPDALSPREALDILYRLKGLL